MQSQKKYQKLRSWRYIRENKNLFILIWTFAIFCRYLSSAPILESLPEIRVSIVCNFFKQKNKQNKNKQNKTKQQQKKKKKKKRGHPYLTNKSLFIH